MQFPTAAAIYLLCTLAGAQRVDWSDIPGPCSPVCWEVVNLSQKCTYVNGNSDYITCVCNDNWAAKWIPTCEACIAAWYKADSEVNSLLSSCSFTATTWTGDTTATATDTGTTAEGTGAAATTTTTSSTTSSGSTAGAATVSLTSSSTLTSSSAIVQSNTTLTSGTSTQRTTGSAQASGTGSRTAGTAASGTAAASAFTGAAAPFASVGLGVAALLVVGLPAVL